MLQNLVTLSLPIILLSILSIKAIPLVFRMVLLIILPSITLSNLILIITLPILLLKLLLTNPTLVLYLWVFFIVGNIFKNYLDNISTLLQ